MYLKISLAWMQIASSLLVVFFICMEMKKHRKTLEYVKRIEAVIQAEGRERFIAAVDKLEKIENKKTAPEVKFMSSK